MIPQFPEFKKLELEDRAEIESVTKNFPPYSDFNFTSLWVWNIRDEMCVSKYKDNLIVKFTDYITAAPYFSFIGKNNETETAIEIFKYLESNGMGNCLRLVPEQVAQNVDKSIFLVKEARDDFDYIYSTHEVGSLRGAKFETKRNQINRFVKRNVNVTTKLADISDVGIQSDILSLLTVWEKNKIDKHDEVALENEKEAILRLFKNSAEFDVLTVLAKVNNDIVGFSIFEIINNEYSICHFHKSDTKLAGVYDFTMREKARHLYEKKVEFINYEQDLGIEKLRHAKGSYRPVFFLRKAIILKN